MKEEQNATNEFYPIFYEINEQIVKRESARDASSKTFFSGLLHDDLVFFRANGTMVRKQAFMEGLDQPDPFVKRTMTEFTLYSVEKDHATVFCIIDGLKKDDPWTYSYRNIRIFKKNGNNWQLHVWYNYEMP